MSEALCNAVDWGCPYSVRTIQLAGMEITTFLLCLLRHRATGCNIIAGFLAGESSIHRRIQTFCKGIDAHVKILLSWAQIHRELALRLKVSGECTRAWSRMCHCMRTIALAKQCLTEMERWLLNYSYRKLMKERRDYCLMVRDKVLEACGEDPRDCNMYLKVDELQGKVDRMATKCRDASKVREARLMVKAALCEYKTIDAVCRDMLRTIDTVAANLRNPEDVLMWCEKARGDYHRYLAEIWRGKYLSKASESYEKAMRWEMSAPPADENVAERVLVHRYSAALNLSILEGDIRGNVSNGMRIAEEALKHMEDSCPKYTSMKRPALKNKVNNRVCSLETYHVIEVIDRIKDLINDYRLEVQIKQRHN